MTAAALRLPALLRRGTALPPRSGGFSALAIARHALSGNRDWTRQWRKATPKPSYDAIVGGGGGHGLATAYYLARELGLTEIAVVERDAIGQGNVGRNTTIVRSN